MKTTPGPWKIHDEQYCIDEIWGNLDGPIDGQIRGTQVCTLEQTPEIYANAKLIAEAPLMLELLVDIHKRLTPNLIGERVFSEMCRLRQMFTENEGK